MGHYMVFSKKLVMIGLLLSSNPLLAEDTAGRKPILTHPFLPKTSGFAFKQAPQLMDANLADQIPDALRAEGLSPRFNLRQKSYNGMSLVGDQRIESISYGFDLDDVPVCDIEVKVHRTLDGSTTIMGAMPVAPLDPRTLKDSQWATAEQLQKIVGETLLMSSLGTSYKIEAQDKCIWADGSKPVWKMTVNAGGLNYEMIADSSEVYRFDPKHFHATGSASVFATNVDEGSAGPIELREMDTSGYLSSKYFQGCLPTSAGKVVCKPTEGAALYQFAQEPNLEFNYDPANDSNKFTQASIFAHTNVALEWLESQGYKNFGSIPIKLVSHAKINNDVNNALYQPSATAGGAAMILVGDGDGDILKNLGTDSDVVSHELGHHVVYSTVTEIRGEALVIHEGLADYLTFARTGNACLGESICTDTPVGLTVCVKPRQCLRSGENDYVLGAKGLSTQAHIQGQIISGMLWDMTAIDGIPQKDVTNLVLKGIDLLVANSGFKHLVVSMLLVDHAEYGDKNCATILARAKTRGFGSVLDDVTCESITSSSGSGTNVNTFLNPGGSVATGSSASKKSSSKSCGVLNAGGGSGQAASLLLILSLPVAITWIRRKKS